MHDPVGRLLLGGAGRLRAIEIEFQTREAFERAAKMLDADPSQTSSVISGYVDGVEVVLILDGSPGYLKS